MTLTGGMFDNWIYIPAMIVVVIQVVAICFVRPVMRWNLEIRCT